MVVEWIIIALIFLFIQYNLNTIFALMCKMVVVVVVGVWEYAGNGGKSNRKYLFTTTTQQ